MTSVELPPARFGTLRGRLLLPAADTPRVDVIDDGLCSFGADGRLLTVSKAPADCAVPETRPGAVWLPGFVDTHIHFPQTRILGSATGPLLDWLQRSVFPEEARFTERAYAAAVAEEFCASLAAQGTTCASIFSASDPGATEVLFAALARWGHRALVGLTLMDRGAPPAVCVPAERALAASERLIGDWHGHDDGRLRFAVTPRFALSCTPKLLDGAARLAERHGLLMQTHLSENRAELEATAAQFPKCSDYFAVYADHGLATARSLFAHCIWLSDGEWDRLAATGGAVSHCPDSNFFLGSGAMPLARPLHRGIRVGLGTDVGAGRTFSLRRVAASAYDAALITGANADAESLLWRATAGGAAALGLDDTIGRLAPGLMGDVIAIDLPEWLDATDRHALFDALVFRRDADPVAAAYVAGRRLASGVTPR
ncbi:MAG: guanine deaminase [Myxococcales bacterium]|nr:guanine deaminase [Myxococcales bacterium]